MFRAETVISSDNLANLQRAIDNFHVLPSYADLLIDRGALLKFKYGWPAYVDAGISDDFALLRQYEEIVRAEAETKLNYFIRPKNFHAYDYDYVKRLIATGQIALLSYRSKVL